MAKIITKYNKISGTPPSGLTTGELAVNLTTGKVYIGGTAGTISLSDSYVNSFNGGTGAVQGVSSVNGNTGAFGLSGGVGITFNVTGNTYSFRISYTSTGVPTLDTVIDSDWLMVDRGKGTNEIRRIRIMDFRNSPYLSETSDAITDYGTSPPVDSFVLQSILSGATATTYKVGLSDFKTTVLASIDGGSYT
jgi:hypothetical protein